MNGWTKRTSYVLFGLLLALAADGAATQEKGGWQNSFPVDKTNLTDTGRGEYFVLEPGYKLIFAHESDSLTVTVLDDTKVVDGVVTRVVEERETNNGKLVEVSRNYFAIDKTNNDVYYFGEDVDIYKNGHVTGHQGSWLSGVNGAKFGLFMPGKPRVGMKYYQEFAPKVAMDRAEIVSVTEEVKVPASDFTRCVRTRETSGMERGSESKWFAPGVGLVRDAEFVLVESSTSKPGRSREPALKPTRPAN